MEIVRLQYEYGSNTILATGGFDIPKTNRIVDLELYRDSKPITVDNFLGYVNAYAYDLTVVHRSIPDFITQSGSITNMSAPNQAIGPDTFFEVMAIGPILNEPGLSNIRGSIAMAKVAAQFVEGGTCVEEGPGCTLVVGTGPDSATSEWFINLNDNSNSLDTANGGFTVFGSVIDDGMDTVDEIAALPTLTFPGFVSDLPIADADPNPDPDAGPVPDFIQANLVMILSATKINRPILRFAPAIANFGFDVPGVVVGKTIDVVLRNTGDESLGITTIAVDDISAPFSIKSENCSDSTLGPLADPFTTTPSSSCTLTLQFQPTATGVFKDNLIINYTSLAVSGGSYSVKYPVLGEGTFGVPRIVVVDKLDITSQVDGFASSKNIIIDNTGQASLQITAVTGLNLTDFSQTSDCIGTSSLIAPGESCTISVNFKPSSFGISTATLTIESNDPVANTINVMLSGFGDSDADGVISAIEDAGPNLGDNNVDNIVDSLQNDVASFLSKTGEYISLVVSGNYIVANILAIPDNQLTNMPTDVEFKHGVVGYDIAVDVPGAIIDVGLVLPAGTAPDAYYLFGVTADNATPHWYAYDPTVIFANALITTSTGDQLVRNLIRITVQDGGSGDADKTVDGKVTIGPAAAAYSVGKNSSGSLNVLLLSILPVIVLLYRRRFVCH